MKRMYRIKVEERQNGNKYFTPQVGTPKLIGRPDSGCVAIG